MVVGLVRADAGEIHIDGVPVHGKPIHQRRAMGLSTCRRKPRYSASSTSRRTSARCFELQLGSDGKPLKTAAINQLLEACARLGAGQACATHRHWHCRVRAAPRRDRPRAGHAAALHPARRAFAGVDPIAVIEIQRIIAFLKGRGIGVLITDHNVREMLGICDVPTSSARAACWPKARRRRSSRTPKCAGFYLASTSACDAHEPPRSLRSLHCGLQAAMPSPATRERAGARSARAQPQGHAVAPSVPLGLASLGLRPDTASPCDWLSPAEGRRPLAVGGPGGRPPMSPPAAADCPQTWR